MRRSMTVTIALAVSMLAVVTLSMGPADGATAATRQIFYAPSGVLRDGQSILVGGTGFEPSAPVYFHQCAEGQCVLLPERVIADESGNFGLALVVHRGFSTGRTEFDCATYPCSLVATPHEDDPSSNENEPTYGAALQFGPRPTITVTPSRGLRDGQTVTVRGTNLVPGQTVHAIQCYPTGGLCTGILHAAAVVDKDGHVTLRGQVSRWLEDYMDPGEAFEATDCAAFHCRVALALYGGYEDGYWQVALEPVDFMPRPALVADHELAEEFDEGTTPVQVAFQLTPAIDRDRTVRYRTLEWSAHAQDFEPASGTVVVPAGERYASVTINVRGDTLDEGNEVFFVEFQGTGRARNAHAIGIVTIFDNERYGF